MSHALFIALSTGQNIANLLPIMELADAGDRVLWVESKTAQALDWGKGATAVLRAEDRLDIDVERLADDDPASVFRLLRSHAAVAGAGQIYLIANGGTKLQMAAALRALEHRDVETLYNSDIPCRLDRVPADPAAALRSLPYQHHCIDLPEILACRGMITGAGSGTRVWPEAGGRVQPGPYGVDAGYTADRHDQLWAWYGGRMPLDDDAPEPQDSARPPSFDDALRLKSAEVKKLQCAIKDEYVNIGHARTVYHTALKLADTTARARVVERAGVQPPAAIGDEFEYAVLARLLDWLEAQPASAAAVQSVWRDVKVARPHSIEHVAQLDIALVLKNGILLSLECKSFNVQRKDIDARLAVLQRSASQLARMAVCAPLYVNYRDRPWFPAMQDVAERLGAWGQIDLLPLTLAGQPEAYTDQRGEQRQVGSFEQALARWLKRYVGA